MIRSHTKLYLALPLLFLASCAAPPPPQQKLPPSSPPFTAPEGVVVPAGTYFMVRMWDSVNTVHHKEGHRWTATLEADLVADGQTVAPRGSIVYLRISQATSAGNLVGRSSLTLQPTDVLIGSRMFPIVAGEVTAVGATGSGQRTVGRTARAAAVGGLIGGSSGARTGAKVGVGASLVTNDGQIQVPAGTLVEFPLVQPLTL